MAGRIGESNATDSPFPGTCLTCPEMETVAMD